MNRIKITITGDIKYIDTNDSYTHVALKHDGKSVESIFRRSEINNPKTVFDRLSDLGLSETITSKQFLVAFNGALKNPLKSELRLTHETGFVGSEYVTSDHTYTKRKGGPRCQHSSRHSFQQEQHLAYKKSTYLPMKADVSKLCENSPIACIAVAAAFAGATGAFLNEQEGFSVYLCGESSTGKSSLLKAGAGFFPKNQSHLQKDAKFTISGLEDRLADGNHRSVFMDELGKYLVNRKADQVEEILHLIANGESRSKSRNPEIQRRFPDLRWMTVVLGAGEDDLLPEISAVNDRGAAARLVQVTIPSQTLGGILTEVDKHSDRRDLLDKLTNAIEKHDGYAWDKFLRLLIKKRRAYNRMLRKRRKQFLEAVGELDSFTLRKAEKYALIAATGELLIRMKLLSLESGHMFEALLSLWSADQEQNPSNSYLDNATRIASKSVAAYLSFPNRIIPDKETLTQVEFFDNEEIYGFIKGRKGNEQIFLKPSVLDEVFDLSDPDKLSGHLKKLQNAGMLEVTKRGTPYRQCSFTDHNGKHQDVKLLRLDRAELESHIFQILD